MAYQVLARRWRPQRFEEVVGQDHVTRTLANAISTGRLAHAFLLCGPRGVGKTTTARILAKCLNCETATDGPVTEPCNSCSTCEEIGAGRSLDVLEIDGASNRGIDEIRDLRENVRYAPSAGRSKVYIIDEVHMLTKEAFNALLKTLEEPPDGVYFVFATTEAHKVPATIRSRCQKYDFHRIPHEVIAETLGKLAETEKFTVEPAALAELARQADGGLRDAQSLLDQAAAVGEGKVTVEGLRSLLGEAEDETYLRILESVAHGRAGDAFEVLQGLLDRGMDPGRIALTLTERLRDLLVVQTAPDSAASLGVRADLMEAFRSVAGAVSSAKLTALLALASRSVSDLRRSSRPRLTLEVALARMSRLEDAGDLAELAARLEASLAGAP
ncbi:MAG: DNA polymerase III subunit gamma/tau, partial [Gemmatimonadetes bacterium]|nr:DNA polymerase III subunit gamma/tau [Gemmatimonadota bacterium]